MIKTLEPAQGNAGGMGVGGGEVCVCVCVGGGGGLPKLGSRCKETGSHLKTVRPDTHLLEDWLVTSL